MALAIDVSTPAVVTANPGPTATTASFTPPTGALLLVSWSGMSSFGVDPPAPTITDSLGSHLTYTLIGWSSRADIGGVNGLNGQAAMWSAEVGTSAAMTVSVTNRDTGAAWGALKVSVVTGQGATPIGASGKGGVSPATSIVQSYTAQATDGWGFLVDCDWDGRGPQTAGTGCTVDASATIGSNPTYAFARRTTADDVNATANTLQVTLPLSSSNLSWVYAEILPVAAAPAPAPDLVAGPYTGPAPGRISPTGQWRPPPLADVQAVALSTAPDGIAVPVALGAPTLANGSMTVAPDGLSVPVAVGSPNVSDGSLSVAPDGITAPVTLGDPTLADVSGTAAPDGLTVTVVLGDPIVGAASVNPDGLAVPVALGSPALSWSGSAAPDGIAVPVSLGSATVSWSGITAPDGISVPVGLGTPALSWSGTTAPDGIAVPVAVGSPAVVGASVSPDSISLPVVLGSPTLVWSTVIAPDGVAVSVAVSAPSVSVPGARVIRPDTGTTARPTAGITARPNTGTTTRPGTGTVTRPNTGIVARP